MLASATTEKASLISQRATSSLLIPARCSACGTASDGAMGKSIGAHAASAVATTRASGASFRACTASPLASTSALAPSLIELAFAAVTVPSLSKAGRSVRTFSRFTRRNSSSSSTVWSPSFGSRIVTGTSSSANAWFSHARVARSYEASA